MKHNGSAQLDIFYGSTGNSQYAGPSGLSFILSAQSTMAIATNGNMNYSFNDGGMTLFNNYTVSRQINNAVILHSTITNTGSQFFVRNSSGTEYRLTGDGVWTVASTNTYHNTGNVGISTNSPAYPLTVGNGLFAVGTAGVGFALGVSTWGTNPTAIDIKYSEIYLGDSDTASSIQFRRQGGSLNGASIYSNDEEIGDLNFYAASGKTVGVNKDGSSAFQIGPASTGIAQHLSGTGIIDFGATAAGTCDIATITVTGALVGNVVDLGIPNALAGLNTYQLFNGYVSATDSVIVKRCNLTNAVTALTDAPSVTIRASVWQYQN